ncbi:MAG: nucleotidyltransferase domain-containing protein [Candidatus Bathyarchaeia archaeon]
MKVIKESPLIKTLERSNADVKFAVLFGSCRRGENNAFSDIDVFVVCGGEDDKSLISNELAQLSLKVEREIHPTLFTLKEFNNRIRHHDYLLASILEDSTFLLGNMDYFLEGRQLILMGQPDVNSISFNRNMGTKILGYANYCLNEFRSCWKRYVRKIEPYDMNRELLLKGLQNYHLALGYLLASKEMKKLNKAMSLRRLLAPQTNSLLKDLISIEKKVRRLKPVNLEVQNVLYRLDSNDLPRRALGHGSAGNK